MTGGLWSFRGEQKPCRDLVGGILGGSRREQKPRRRDPEGEVGMTRGLGGRGEGREDLSLARGAHGATLATKCKDRREGTSREAPILA